MTNEFLFNNINIYSTKQDSWMFLEAFRSIRNWLLEYDMLDEVDLADIYVFDYDMFDNNPDEIARRMGFVNFDEMNVKHCIIEDLLDYTHRSPFIITYLEH